MSYIQTSGYGYRKLLCEDVTTWFLNQFIPRHKVSVEILHRGLKRDCVYGYCDVVNETYRPRDFLIEIQSHLPEELYVKTLLHELVHLRQWVLGDLRMKRGKMYHGTTKVEDLDYEDQPHEIEARNEEEVLYHRYIHGTEEVAPSFTFIARHLL